MKERPQGRSPSPPYSRGLPDAATAAASAPTTTTTGAAAAKPARASEVVSPAVMLEMRPGAPDVVLARESNFLPLENFDDEIGELHTPDEWVQLGRVWRFVCLFAGGSLMSFCHDAGGRGCWYAVFLALSAAVGRD